MRNATGCLAKSVLAVLSVFLVPCVPYSLRIGPLFFPGRFFLLCYASRTEMEELDDGCH